MVCANSLGFPLETDYKPHPVSVRRECGGNIQFNERDFIRNRISTKKTGDGRKWCAEQLILMLTPGQAAYRWFRRAVNSRSHSAANYFGFRVIMVSWCRLARKLCIQRVQSGRRRITFSPVVSNVEQHTLSAMEQFLITSSCGSDLLLRAVRLVMSSHRHFTLEWNTAR